MPLSRWDNITIAVPVKLARNTALDAYRGFVMLLMMAEALNLSRVSHAYPGNAFWGFLAWNQTHVPWVGCSLHDTIQPGFSFLVGAALPYSIASRLAKGATTRAMLLHALWRSLVLVALGIALRSLHSPLQPVTFEDTLTQIGLGYPFLFALGLRPPRWQWIALAAILSGYWLAWAIYPVAGPYAAHWYKDVNAGNAFDRWFLNLFPRATPFLANSGGYLTLSFIPTLGTMLLGLAAGRWLRAAAPGIPMRRLLAAGAVCAAAGLTLHFTGICPIVKRIWTPAWTLFSGGLCFFFLAVFCWLIEVKGWRRWAFPILVIGMNSIAAYLIAERLRPAVYWLFRLIPGPSFAALIGTGLEPLMRGAAVLLIYWLMLYAMYRRRIFLRI